MMLRTVMVAAVVTFPTAAWAANRSLPADLSPNVVTDFGAVGDGVTDDTAAIQAALLGDRTQAEQDSSPDYYDPRPRVVYFPPGTYLVSDTLVWLGTALQVQGAGDQTVLRLEDGAPGFSDPSQPKPVLQTMDGNYSFKQHIFDLVVDTGTGNPGAVGIDWIANNLGALRRITVRSGDGQGVAGVDMTRAWPGPALLRDVQVEGFEAGIRVGNAEYGLTLEDITLRNQRTVGLSNTDNVLAIRHMTTEGVPLAIDNSGSGGHVILLDSQLNGSGAEAIRNEGHVFLRRVASSGFDALLLEHGTARPGTAVLDEYLTGTVQQLFDSPQHSLDLPIREVPEPADEPASDWYKIDCDYQGCEGVLQPALDSGKSTLYFSSGVRLVGGGPYRVPASVQRIVGFGTHINAYDESGLTFEVTEASEQPLIIEHFAGALKLKHSAKRQVVVRSCQVAQYDAGADAGELLLDDVGWVTDQPLTPAAGQRVWAWQLNIEGDQLHIDNVGGYVWVLGLKSERRGTIARTTAGGYTEFLGTLLYGTASWETDNAAFVNEESSHSVVFSMSSYVDNGFYPYLIEETRDGVLKRQPSSALDGRTLPLFVGYRETAPTVPGLGGTGGLGANTAGSGASVSSGPGAGGSGGSGAQSGSKDSAGCGCHVHSAGTGLGGMWVVMLALRMARRRWRR